MPDQARFAAGSSEKLHLGNISVQRDWGWAPEYVEAMYLMLQQDEPDDYVIATGVCYPLDEFVRSTFVCAGLDWGEHLVTDASLYRPTEIAVGLGNPRQAKEKLGWEAKYRMPDVVRMMVEARMV